MTKVVGSGPCMSKKCPKSPSKKSTSKKKKEDDFSDIFEDKDVLKLIDETVYENLFEEKKPKLSTGPEDYNKPRSLKEVKEGVTRALEFIEYLEKKQKMSLAAAESDNTKKSKKKENKNTIKTEKSKKK